MVRFDHCGYVWIEEVNAIPSALGYVEKKSLAMRRVLFESALAVDVRSMMSV